MINVTFDNLVDIVRNLSLEEKEEILLITEKSIVEERREEIFNNYQESLKEYQSGSLKFSNKIEELKRMM